MQTNTWGRRDHRRAELINDVRRVDVDRRAVAQFLAEVGVPFPVICRVINEPTRRRTLTDLPP